MLSHHARCSSSGPHSKHLFVRRASAMGNVISFNEIAFPWPHPMLNMFRSTWWRCGLIHEKYPCSAMHSETLITSPLASRLKKWVRVMRHHWAFRRRRFCAHDGRRGLCPWSSNPCQFFFRDTFSVKIFALFSNCVFIAFVMKCDDNDVSIFDRDN